MINNRRFPDTYFRTEKGGEGEMVICGKEVLAEVSSAASFQQRGFGVINPQNDAIFPKLSAIARTFEQWRFRKLKFHFVTGCAATTAGSVMQYVDYDATDAAAPSAIALLANQTAMVSSVALDNTIEYDVNRQMLSKMYSDLSVNSGSLREAVAGTWFLFMDKGAATDVFAGYVYVEYECAFYTPKPPSPNGGAGQTSQALVLTAGSSTALPLPVIASEVGLPGQIATNPTSTYTNAGGIVGVLDYARNVYEAGKWILSAYGDMSSASLDVKDGYVDEDEKSIANDLDEKPMPNGWDKRLVHGQFVPRCRKGFLGSAGRHRWRGIVEMDLNNTTPREKRPVRAPLASGDVTLMIVWYDVTNGNINPDFPASESGMTFVGDSQIAYTGSTSAVSPTLTTPLTVPAGKRYMVECSLTLGATTGRTLEDFTFTSVAAGIQDI